MDFRFIQQRKAESITTLDVIELYNCGDSGYTAGQYRVATVEPDTGDVTLVGLGGLSGYVAVVSFGDGNEQGEQERV